MPAFELLFTNNLFTVSIFIAVGKAIQCARLMMIEPQMSVNSNFNSHMTCPIGSSCFLYKASVTMEAAFFQRTCKMLGGQ